jgi:hypothetical protein
VVTDSATVLLMEERFTVTGTPLLRMALITQLGIENSMWVTPILAAWLIL